MVVDTAIESIYGYVIYRPGTQQYYRCTVNNSSGTHHIFTDKPYEVFVWGDSMEATDAKTNV